MGRVITTRALPVLLLAVAAVAQEAPAPASPVAADSANKAVPATAANQEEQRTSSRYHLAAADARISAISASFAMAARPSDPFGLMQDPSLKPVVHKIIRPGSTRKNIAPVPFSEVVAAIQVTAVMPTQQRFLIKDRTFTRGNTFPILYRDKSVTVEVVHVANSAITFRNIRTKELANLKLNMLPPGMARGSDGAKGPPGLERDNPSAPIKVDVATPQTDIPTSRARSARR